MKKLSDIFNVLRNSPIVERFVIQFPYISKFILNRLSVKKFIGLPLTLLIIVFVANLILFNELSENIANAEWVLSIDKSLTQYLFHIRNDCVAKSFFYFSKIGSNQVIIPMAILVMLIFIFQKRYSSIFALLIALTGTSITSYYSKLYFHRIRPVDFGFYDEHTYSFPSGHAMYSVAFYGFLFYYSIRNTKKYKLPLAFISIAFILLLGFSRLYLGVHYLSDVFAGYSLGFLWFLFAVSVLKWKETHHDDKN